MSHTAHIRSHRKPRRSASTIAVRAGVAGGVLSTLAVAGASGSANAAEPVTQTLELPTLTADLAAQVAQSADATQQTAANYQLQAERDQAAANAAKQAKADLADAKQKAAEAKKKAQEAARKAAAERASRNAERTTLSTTASTSTGTATGSAAAVVAFVKAQIGKAYVSGATGPSAYDCSGLVQTAFKQVGISLPRVSQDQSTAGTQVSLSNLQPGDILYWGSAGSAYHVAVYVGDGMFVGAQNPSSGVGEHPLSYDPPTGAVRVL
ncbi:C40 family peptidase [Streptomyces diastatochromogenes]|uniref:C40 family peptidase n=1 Tax=Streptomyces diastatochromogenes TaxID=42236 RepID=UPI000B9184F6|nr:C40 family peptidase [Streptomyces diastatochromogenes]MCZ0987572.1 C40 family peptidase [Streptomyces diastatochromogenes]